MPLPVAGPSWTLLRNGLLAFVRPATSEEPERLLLSLVDCCTTKGCMCRDVGLRSVEYELASFRAQPPTDLSARLGRGAALESRVDLDFGTVTPDDFEGRLPLSGEWLAFLSDEVDGALLDALHARWLEAKGIELSRPDLSTLASEPDLLIGWQGSQPQLRDDSFLIEGRTFIADELYCLAPGCDCDEVVVDFIELFADEESAPLGGIRLRVHDGSVVDRHVEPAEQPQLEALWSAYRKRHRGTSHLGAHRRVLLDAHQHLANDPGQKTRVARNDACPCGSGQKYKRCCMGLEGDGSSR